MTTFDRHVTEVDWCMEQAAYIECEAVKYIHTDHSRYTLLMANATAWFNRAMFSRNGSLEINHNTYAIEEATHDQ